MNTRSTLRRKPLGIIESLSSADSTTIGSGVTQVRSYIYANATNVPGLVDGEMSKAILISRWEQGKSPSVYQMDGSVDVCASLNNSPEYELCWEE